MLAIPVVGVFSSMLMLGERPDWREYLAMLLVVMVIGTVIVPIRADAAAGSAKRRTERRDALPHNASGL